ncbi:GntR family transcriptional regulator [Actinomadura madurae]|uniref:GntR family transcriptional regulator n=1 Tax=Actinomadura madurae TaxID=1993 RepID=UPI002026438B|nr:GntR family transcriptional regulator [Actinomadura madurae]MCP9955381.1 GntR family transcriptional regulator [Actinomadura madurae]MCP9972122.1 GntR family transcriptional regulator [Actinomadura madurae]MCP9984621.1 GntR family transcriptional regulator [Actinomadura madurae]MCQ0003829.1 GntR family transcriptional regulator [Actinomadura madurae]MCQ0020814.1 GntR family transcriptional regulator [Actinomadura madurae]
MAERNKPEGAGSPSTTGMGLRAPIGRVAAPLRDQVLQVVREAILDFRLRPGQRLIERELMEQLSVSRATVREVLAQLASEGLVTNIPQRGAIVSVLTTDEAADIYEMRVALESLAVRRFVERATEEHMSRLRAALEELEAARKSEGADLARLIAKDELYKALFAGADSPPLTQMLTSLQGRLRRLRWTSLSAPGRLDRTIAEMRTLVEAIEERDVGRAMAASDLHVRNAAAIALARMAEATGEPAEGAGTGSGETGRGA